MTVAPLARAARGRHRERAARGAGRGAGRGADCGAGRGQYWVRNCFTSGPANWAP
jgi:hypothetical protein